MPCHSSLPLPLALILHSGRGETLPSLAVSFSHLEKSPLPLSCCLCGKEQASALCWPSSRCPWSSLLFVFGFLPSSPLMPREHLMTQKSSDSSSLSAKCGAQIRVSGFELGSQPQTFVPGRITQHAYASLQDSLLLGFHDKAIVNLTFPFSLCWTATICPSILL